MPTISDEKWAVVIQDLTRQIEALMKENDALKRQAEQADSEASRFKVEVMQLESGQLELVARLEDSMNEVNRLGMVLKHQADNLSIVQHLPPHKHE